MSNILTFWYIPHSKSVNIYNVRGVTNLKFYSHYRKIIMSQYQGPIPASVTKYYTSFLLSDTILSEMQSIAVNYIILPFKVAFAVRLFQFCL